MHPMLHKALGCNELYINSVDLLTHFLTSIEMEFVVRSKSERFCSIYLPNPCSTKLDRVKLVLIKLQIHYRLDQSGCSVLIHIFSYVY